MAVADLDFYYPASDNNVHVVKIFRICYAYSLLYVEGIIVPTVPKLMSPEAVR